MLKAFLVRAAAHAEHSDPRTAPRTWPLSHPSVIPPGAAPHWGMTLAKDAAARSDPEPRSGELHWALALPLLEHIKAPLRPTPRLSLCPSISLSTCPSNTPTCGRPGRHSCLGTWSPDHQPLQKSLSSTPPTTGDLPRWRRQSEASHTTFCREHRHPASPSHSSKGPRTPGETPPGRALGPSRSCPCGRS